MTMLYLETWVISKENKRKIIHLDFEGLSEDYVMTMEKSYGVHVREDRDNVLYLPKRKPRSSKKKFTESNGMKTYQDSCLNS